MKVITTKQTTISARVFRASTGQYEDLGVIYQSGLRDTIKNIINRLLSWLQF